MAFKIGKKEYDIPTVVSVSVIVYFWVLVGFFKFPEFLSEYYQVRLTFLAVGVLLCKFISKDESRLLARLKTKKIITNYGVYEWDGGRYKVWVDDKAYCVFYEGINAENIHERGNVVFICPEEFVSQAGMNILIKAELSQDGTIPAELEQFVQKSKFRLYGTVQSADFGEITAEVINYKTRAEALEITNAALRKTVNECMKLLSDKQTIKNMRSEDLAKSIENALGAAKVD